MHIEISVERKQDYAEVESVIKKAFLEAEHTDGKEHLLVARLRGSEIFNPQMSLVAKFEGRIVGHILFSPIIIEDPVIKKKFASVALAPVSVVKEFQGQGVGDALIQEGHRQAIKEGFASSIVLGHSRYYPKFGYRPACDFNIKPPFEVPNENFMACELVENGLAGVEGNVIYPAEFGL